MKYEAPICELIKIDMDIIRTSGADDNDKGQGDTPGIDWELD